MARAVQTVALLALLWLDAEAPPCLAPEADSSSSEVQPNPADGRSARLWLNLEGWKRSAGGRHSQALGDWQPPVARLRARSLPYRGLAVLIRVLSWRLHWPLPWLAESAARAVDNQPHGRDRPQPRRSARSQAIPETRSVRK